MTFVCTPQIYIYIYIYIGIRVHKINRGKSSQQVLTQINQHLKTTTESIFKTVLNTFRVGMNATTVTRTGVSVAFETT